MEERFNKLFQKFIDDEITEEEMEELGKISKTLCLIEEAHNNEKLKAKASIINLIILITIVSIMAIIVLTSK